MYVCIEVEIMVDLNILASQFDDEGRYIAMKGTIRKKGIFSIITDKTLFWAEQGIEYIGG